MDFLPGVETVSAKRCDGLAARRGPLFALGFEPPDAGVCAENLATQAKVSSRV